MKRGKYALQNDRGNRHKVMAILGTGTRLLIKEVRLDTIKMMGQRCLEMS